ncbi:MAG: alpha/beta fold hydrolase [Chloroflexaceae bacterium]|nr:alpha/beta fold hydrolase [Chloroflexaceae bacterium]
MFAYDWRRDLDWISAAEANEHSLATLIEQVREQTGAAQVVLIGHSMGGLVAQRYIDSGTNAEHVATLITIGTPWLGAVSAMQALWFGSDFGMCFFEQCILNPAKARTLARHFPSIYTLLPTATYYEYYHGADGRHPRPFRGVNEQGRFDPQGEPLSFAAWYNVMANHPGMSRLLYDQVLAIQQQTRVAPGVAYHHLVGFTDTPTTPGILQVVPLDPAVAACTGESCPMYDEAMADDTITSIDGDGVVPIGSAVRCVWQGQPIPESHVYQFQGTDDQAGHLKMLNNPQARQTILALLHGNTVAGNLCAATP